MYRAYYKFAAWTLVVAIALYLEEGPIVLIPAIAVLAIGWWAVERYG
jgi:hypothetical protein